MTESTGSQGSKAPPDSSGGGQRIKSILSSRLLRAGVSLGLLALLLVRTDLSQLGETLRGVSFSMLAVAFLIFLVCNLVNVYKWQLIIRKQGLQVSSIYLTKLYYMGLFFNNFLPTNIGGDVVKVWKLSKVTGKGHDAVSSVVIDRAGSTLGILLLALVPTMFRLSQLGTNVAIPIFAMFFIAVLLIAFLSSERAVRALGRFRLFRADPFGLRNHLKSFYYSLYQFRDHKLTLALFMLWSLVYQALHILTVYFVALALDIEIPAYYYFLFVPVVMAVTMMPISLNGVGTREVTWVLLFRQVIEDPELARTLAISLSLLSFVVISMISLAGGVFYLLDRSTPPLTEEEASAIEEEERGAFSLDESGSGATRAMAEETNG
ncbi:MAG: flippase-like domain-containing protein [Actinobacteria bacterium]|nr:flippase-like domain-containing protein [Actinomycetota bacterium]MCL5883511.1 flippase-like domain-containing protein [Actinomycetota bacterium]